MLQDIALLGFGEGAWGGALAKAVMMTVAVSVCAFVTGFVGAGFLAWSRIAGGSFLRRASAAYSIVFRGVPDLLVIYLFYFGGRQVASVLGELAGYNGPVQVSGFMAGMLAIGMISAAGQAEVLRGAYAAIPRGTLEASIVGGMGRWTLLHRTIFPLGAVTALPGLGNQWQSVVKESALVSVTGLVETMRMVTIASGSTELPFLFYGAGAAAFLMITTVSDVAFRLAESRVARWSTAMKGV